MSTNRLCLLCSKKATMAYNCDMMPTYCSSHASGGMVTATGNGQYEYYMCGGWLRDQSKKNEEIEKKEKIIDNTNISNANATYICVENNCNNLAIFSSRINGKPTVCRKHTGPFMVRTIQIKN